MVTTVGKGWREEGECCEGWREEGSVGEGWREEGECW